MIALDTTILAYAVGSDHVFREPCRRIVAAVGARAVVATTTVEVIQELVHVRARRTSRREAALEGVRFARLLSPLLVPTADDLSDGLQLFATHDRLGAFDAVLAATVRNAPNVTAVVSADKGFDSVLGLQRIDPAADDLPARLGLAD